jgi:tRNA(Ile)-lysidine synthase
MLTVTRADVEAYLRAFSLPWRDDPTNADPAYLRNRVRTLLVPTLTAHFPGWDTALIAGAEKAADDARALEAAAAAVPWAYPPGSASRGASREGEEQADDDAVTVTGGYASGSAPREASCGAATFFALPRAIRRRGVYHALAALGVKHRVPHKVIASFIDGTASRLQSGNLTLTHAEGRIVLRVGEAPGDAEADGGFYAILTHPGTYRIPEATPGDHGDVTSTLTVTVGEDIAVRLPLCVRSPLPGDRIRFPNGTDRRLIDLFRDRHIPAEERRRVVVVETIGTAPRILLVAADHLGHRASWGAARPPSPPAAGGACTH